MKPVLVPDAFARVYGKRGAHSLARIAAIGVPLARLADVGRVADRSSLAIRRFRSALADVGIRTASSARRSIAREFGDAAGISDVRPEQRPQLQAFLVAPASFADAVTDRGIAALQLPASFPYSPHEACRTIARALYHGGRSGRGGSFGGRPGRGVGDLRHASCAGSQKAHRPGTL
jgi:hypothetical protein